MKVTIAGDLVIDRVYSLSSIDNNLIKVFKESDLRIVNLEAPITEKNKKIKKSGPNLKSNQISTKNILEGLDINIVTLANNHILDYDQSGVIDTINFCKKNNIDTVGAGIDLNKASETLYLETIEGSIALINFAENEWSSATKSTAGSNPMNFIDNFKQIQDAKAKADFVIVIVHGGNEYNHIPSPNMIKQYRFYAEVGADAVLAHHTHCISGFEVWKGVPIFYSLGNFLFTKDVIKDKSWYDGLVVQLDIKKGEKIKYNYYFVSQTPLEHKLKLVDNKDLKGLLLNINDVIQNEEKVNTIWEEFAKNKSEAFYKSITPIAAIKNKYLKYIIYKTGLHKLFLNETYLKEHLNRIRCESHLDISRYMLKNLLFKSNDGKNY